MGDVDLSTIIPFVARIVGAQDADDVAADAVVKVLARHRSFRHESRWQTWVLAIAKRTAIDHLRARTREARIFTPLNGHDVPVEADAERHDPRLVGVPDDVRAIVEAWDQHGTQAAAAAALGIPLGRLKKRLELARRGVGR